MTERIVVAFLGRHLGTASEWDGDIGRTWWVYDFKPNGDVPLRECQCLQFDEDNGRIIEQDNAENDLRIFPIQWSFGDVIVQS